MDEPTIPELIRDLQQGMDTVASTVQDIRSTMQAYQTKEVADARHEAVDRRLTALEESRKATARLVASAFVLPLLVALLSGLIFQGMTK